MKYELPILPYNYDALEPYIDEQTMRIHHDKHFQTYADNFNASLEGIKGLENYSAEEIVEKVNEIIPENMRQAVINNGGGYINHKLFFNHLGKGYELGGKIKDAIINTFGSVEEFKKQFEAAGKGQFGSGWAFLVVDKNNNLKIVKKPNQNSPLTDGETPILSLDVWEHAYYLKYQNRRAEYVSNFWNVINWNQVEQNYLKAIK